MDRTHLSHLELCRSTSFSPQLFLHPAFILLSLHYRWRQSNTRAKSATPLPEIVFFALTRLRVTARAYRLSGVNVCRPAVYGQPRKRSPVLDTPAEILATRERLPATQEEGAAQEILEFLRARKPAPHAGLRIGGCPY